MGRFNQAGAALVCVTQNFSTADAMGRLTLNMLMSFAELEAVTVREIFDLYEQQRSALAVARLLEERIEGIGEQLATHERRMAEVQRALTSLARTEIETRWVDDSLAHFDTVWDAMNPESRGRLTRAIVEKVEIDERSGQVTAVLVNLDLGDDDFVPVASTPPATETKEARA